MYMEEKYITFFLRRNTVSANDTLLDNYLTSYEIADLVHTFQYLSIMIININNDKYNDDKYT